MSALISTAETQFASTTGDTMPDMVSWFGTNLIQPWLYGGLAILYELRYWIIASVIFMTVIFFVYRWLKFGRH